MEKEGHDPFDQDISPLCEPITKTGHAALAEGDQVHSTIVDSNVNVVAGNIYNINNGPENELDQEQLRVAVQGFVAKTKLHLQKEIGIKRTITVRPTMIILDMKGTSAEGLGSGHGDGNTLFGRDQEEISLNGIHAPQNEIPTKHVTILGEAGAGKTTISGMYSLAVADGNVETLDNIQLVHFISAATLQTRTDTTAFDLLFTDQMAHDRKTKLSLREQKAGRAWLEKNSRTMLLTIDGLDQCLKEFGNENYPIVTVTNSAKANEILANIMSGRIWRDARVLTTSRWNTYWNIKADLKPDKVVGLRGLDDNNLKKFAFSHSIDGDLIFTQLENTSPKLLSLCRNPMFLNYTTKIFQKNRNTLPESLSGLMSAFFRQFLNSDSEKYYGHITKLGYEAMRENKFVFSHSYLRSLGIDPKHLNDFLSTGAVLEDGLDKAKSFDRSFEFSHQTMQEFCCTLHIPSLTRDEIKEFVTKQLNESRMELTRQFLYGLILDVRVTEPMNNYLAYRVTNIHECRRILMENLYGMMENGTIRELKTIKLLGECGDETVENINTKVQRIVIDDLPYLLQNDRMLLASMINKLLPLEEVIVNRFVLDPSVIELGKSCIASVDVFKVGAMIIEDKDLMNESVTEYLDIFGQCHSRRIFLYKCHLNKENLKQIAQVCQTRDIQLPELIIFDSTMTSDAYSELASVLKASECTYVHFGNCDLSTENLKCFERGCQKKQVSLQKLGIRDISMEEDEYEMITHILKLTDCEELQLDVCCLTNTKLLGVLRGCRNNNIQLLQLKIFDKTMPCDAYSDLADVVKACECSYVFFGNCNLTKKKLECFRSRCQEIRLSFQKLGIRDTSMEEDGYERLIHILSLSGCNELVLDGCFLTKKKWQGVLSGCRNLNIQLPELTIYDSTMPSDAYSYLAPVVKSCECISLYLANCNLSKDKLECFALGCKDNHVSLDQLNILDSTMPSSAYSDMATVVKASKCTFVFFGDCHLSKDKLECFGMGCKENQVSWQKLGIEDISMKEDGYEELTHILKLSGCEELLFSQCYLTKKKLQRLLRGCRNQNVQLLQLNIFDSAMPCEAYSDMAAVVKASDCTYVFFGDCDLSKEKLKCFKEGCKENNVSLSAAFYRVEAVNMPIGI